MADMERERHAREKILARLRASREEIQRVFDPPPTAAQAAAAPGSVPRRASAQFPRSRTMRALMSYKGLTAVGASAAGLLLARPGLALKILRMVPASTVGRMLLVRALTSFRSHRDR